MQYKTIVLELLQQYPETHERLKESRTLLSTIELLAAGLKESHETLKKQLAQAHRESGEAQVSSAALELALAELEAALRPASPPDGDDPLSLDAAMAYLHRHSRPA
jgi:hypothetical protein